jgi:hypothetical protein
MNEPAQRGDNQPRKTLRSALARSAKIAVVVLCTILVLIVFMIWLGGDTTTLPFDYDGFD